MKSQKGITILSLTVYVIAFAIVIGIVATITGFFYKNVKDISVDINPLTEFATFNSYFADEVNHSNLNVKECSTDNGQSYIIFSNNVQYTYVPANKAIYKNKIKICKDISNCTFEEKIEEGKTIITVKLEADNQQRTTTYTLRN